LGKISEIINGMISKVLESSEFTSASPGHINTLIQINAIENPDFESKIKEIIKEETKNVIEKPDDSKVKQEKKLKIVEDKVKGFEKGNLGDIHNFTSEQFSNVKDLASDPAQFIFRSFFRKFARGAGVIGLALLIFEAVQWIISELLKPGRWLDRRFRREIENEILRFRSREEKQKLQQGFSQIIVTSTHSLRGGQGQTYNNYRQIGSNQPVFQEKRFVDEPLDTSGGDLKFGKRKRFGQ